MEVWPYAWVPQNVGEVEQTVGLGKKLGARRVLFWDASQKAASADASMKGGL